MSAAMDSNTNTIYVALPDEGTPVWRHTQGVRLPNGNYLLLPTPNYDSKDEHWEFVPGSVVRCVFEEHEGEMILIAKKLIK